MRRPLCDSVAADCRRSRVIFVRSIGRRFTSTEVCCADAACAAPKTSSPMKKARILPLVLPFLVPSHLDSLELRLVRGLRVVVEPVELKDALERNPELHRDVEERFGQSMVLVRELPLLELDGRGLAVLDESDLRHHTSFTLRPASASRTVRFIVASARCCVA